MSYKTHQDLVKEFMASCGQYSDNSDSYLIDLVKPSSRDTKIVKLRAIMLLEKLQEIFESLFTIEYQDQYLEPLFLLIKLHLQKITENDLDLDLDRVSKYLADLEYLSIGACVSLGIDSDIVFQKVHENNLTKIDPITGKINRRTSDSKVLQYHNYVPLDLKKCREEWLKEK